MSTALSVETTPLSKKPKAKFRWSKQPPLAHEADAERLRASHVRLLRYVSAGQEIPGCEDATHEVFGQWVHQPEPDTSSIELDRTSGFGLQKGDAEDRPGITLAFLRMLSHQREKWAARLSSWEIPDPRKVDMSSPISPSPTTYGAMSEQEMMTVNTSLWTREGWWRLLGQIGKRDYMAMFMLSACISCLTYTISTLVECQWAALRWIFDQPNSSGLWIFAVSLWFRLFLVALALFITTFGPHAAGSGIPELKAVFGGGIHLKGYLSFTTLLIKSLGLAAALGSGLPLGKVGPFVHIACIAGEQMHRRIGWFRQVDHSMILAAASAGGVSACFGAPVGGVLFSIEVTSTVFNVSNYWTAFFCSVSGFAITRLLFHFWFTPLHLFQFPVETILKNPFADFELIIFVAMGAGLGLVGVVFIKSYAKVVSLRRKYQAQWIGSHPYGIALLVTFLFHCATFWTGEFARRPYREVNADFFLAYSFWDPTDPDFDVHDWATGLGVFFNLSTWILVMFLFCVVSLGLSLPCGVFAPLFAIGAGLGRLLGELLIYFFPHGVPGNPRFEPTVYAVVGGAALASGCTQTLSAAIIILELTGELKLLLPTLLAVTVSCGISSFFGPSIYGRILRLLRIPQLSTAPPRFLRVPIPEKQDTDSSLNIPPLIGAPPRSPPMASKSPNLHLPTGRVARTHSFDSYPPRRGVLMSNAKSLLAIQREAREGKERREAPITIIPQENPNPNEDYWMSSSRVNRCQFVVLPSATVTANQIMLPIDQAVVVGSPSALELRTLLGTYQHSFFPIVHSHQNRILFGEVTRGFLVKYLQYLDDEQINEAQAKLKTALGGQQQRRPILNFTDMPFLEHVNYSPLQLTAQTELSQIYRTFQELHPHVIYITAYSRLIGCITELHLISLEHHG